MGCVDRACDRATARVAHTSTPTRARAVGAMAKVEEISNASDGRARAAADAGKNGREKTIEGGAGTAVKTTTEDATAATAAAPQQPMLSPKMFISPVLLMGSKRLGIDFKNPEHVMKIRMGFVFSMTVLSLALAALWLTMKRRKKKLDEDQVEVKVKDMQTGVEKAEKVTLYEHDVQEFRKVLAGIIMSGVMACGMHFGFKVGPPLLLQSIMLPLNLWDGNLWQMHMLGRDEKHNPALKRPFQAVKQQSPFAAIAEAMSPESKKKREADTKRLEKNVSKGSKLNPKKK